MPSNDDAPIEKKLQLALDEVERDAEPDYPDWRRGFLCAGIAAAAALIPLGVLVAVWNSFRWPAALGVWLVLTAAVFLLFAFRPTPRRFY